MNLPANPPQMNTGMRDTQFDSMNPRMQGHLLNQQPLQQQLQQQQLQQQQLQQKQQQQQGNIGGLMNNKPVGMNQPQQSIPGLPGPMSVASSLQQASVAGSMIRSGSEIGLTSVQSSVANTNALSQAPTQLVSMRQGNHVTLTPLYTNGFFLLVWYNKIGIVHFTYLGVSGYNLIFFLYIFKAFFMKQCRLWLNAALCCISSWS